jgi:hypothetical protein
VNGFCPEPQFLPKHLGVAPYIPKIFPAHVYASLKPGFLQFLIMLAVLTYDYALPASTIALSWYLLNQHYLKPRHKLSELALQKAELKKTLTKVIHPRVSRHTLNLRNASKRRRRSQTAMRIVNPIHAMS